MSRVGKKPVLVPQGVTASVEGQTVKVKGAKGALSLVVPDEVTVKMDKGGISLNPKSETKRADLVAYLNTLSKSPAALPK